MPLATNALATLADAKARLKIGGTDDDGRLTGVINAASQLIVNRIGQVAGSPTVEEWHDGGSPTIMLRNSGPLQSVSTVAESYGTIFYTLSQVTLDSGSVGSTYTYTVDLSLGLLTRRAAGVAVCFASGRSNIHVIYVAGYATTPADIAEAALLQIQHMWTQLRGPSAKPAQGNPGEPAGASVLAPRVEEILRPYIDIGIA
jgi:hypothetical protein